MKDILLKDFFNTHAWLHQLRIRPRFPSISTPLPKVS
jgi:hypothetical protein